jgi:hypothetical protein
MAADCFIHVMEGITNEELNLFENEHFSSDVKWDPIYDRVSATPDVWIGEAEWLKAAILDQVEAFVPGPVVVVADLYRERPVITDELIENTMIAFDSPNKTNLGVVDRELVRAFLETHKGKRAFTISW